MSTDLSTTTTLSCPSLLSMDAFGSSSADEISFSAHHPFFAAAAAAAAAALEPSDMSSSSPTIVSTPSPFPPLSMADLGALTTSAIRNSSKTLKCPKCNWHYKYQETLEIHMKEKHADSEVKCLYCVEGRQHPRLARGETYSCGYKPYRCEVCKYSTTTKGNLSIHMQSDKHLHAVQEMPTQMVPPSSSLPPRSPSSSSTIHPDHCFVCLVCGVFSSDSPNEILAHVEKDRSRTQPGDVSSHGGLFRCHICPYSTPLKANFHLHTRTDKHIQRVQMVNHLREGSVSGSSLARFGAIKALVQVLCRRCGEVCSTSESLREHASSVHHRGPANELIFDCTLCSFQARKASEAVAHLNAHDCTNWLKIEEEDVEEIEETACPLCEEKPDRRLLGDHLVQIHNTAESAVPRLLVASLPFHNDAPFPCRGCSRQFTTEIARDEHSIGHCFRTLLKCPSCSFSTSKSEDLVRHSEDSHPTVTSCTLCSESFPSRAAFSLHTASHDHLQRAKRHLETAEGVDLSLQLEDSPSFRCNLCTISFPSSPPLDAHLRTPAHQQRMVAISELVAAGEVDPDRPILELPGGPAQKLIRELVDDEPAPAASATATASTTMAAPQMAMQQMLSLSHMIQLFQQQQQQQTSGSNGETVDDVKEEELEDDDTRPPRDETSLFAVLERLADPAAMAQARDLQETGQLGSLPEESWMRASRSECLECNELLPSIMALKQHCEDSHSSSSFPSTAGREFVERLRKELEERGDGRRELKREASEESDESTTQPPEKKAKKENTTPDMSQMNPLNMLLAQAAAAGGMSGLPFPFTANPFMAQEMMNNLLRMNNMNPQLSALANANPAKRARTRITDDQLKVLRQYFDINNSPTEEQIREMSIKASLPEKVIKHWFRNTLFKERQRDKDSPYNFNNPPLVGIDLVEYEKSGEARVVPLNPQEVSQSTPSTSATTEVRLEPVTTPTSIETTAAAPAAPAAVAAVVKEITQVQTPAALSLQSMLNNVMGGSADLKTAFPFGLPEASNLANMLTGGLSLPQPTPQMASSSSATGRRANRTRFTDHQLRTLQQFFDKQAYPKDDDLEMLSKKLQLSPRVIVVWFQNARQKARKIYENQPNAEGAERFVRTPGCNFQCKRCSLVFQRYYELIEHQQKKCYKDDSRAAADDNKNEGLHTDERLASTSMGPVEVPAGATVSVAGATPVDLAKLLGKSSTEALLKMCEEHTRSQSAASSTNSSSPTGMFHKRCPLCALLFRSASSMQEHLSSRHPEHPPIDLDLLPDADDVRAALDPLRREAPLDLSGQGERGESLSISPFFVTSDGDDCETFDDSTSPFNIGLSRSPASSGNKRYRTHLTPMQVHVMKCVFADYKTPSMSECEMLGREVGLHKRVVQVWFQNARAKERKCRGNGDEGMRGTATSCSTCGVEYSGRIGMQEHIFSSEHLNKLKRANPRGDEDRSDNSDDSSRLLRAPAVRDTGKPRNGQPVPPPSTSSRTQGGSFPLNLLYGLQGMAAAAAGGIPLMMDPSVIGTPIPLLQIPENVMTQITADLSAGHAASTFTQDGQTIDGSQDELEPEDAVCLEGKDVQVGWACPGCANVFQRESLLNSHQKSMCTTVTGSFGLIQTHYRCVACDSMFGSSKEFKTHISTADHIAKRDE